MYGETRLQVNIESSDLNALAEGDIFGITPEVDTDGINLALSKEAIDYLNDLQDDDLRGHLDMDTGHPEMDNILIEYYAQSPEERTLTEVMKGRPTWINVGGWGNIIYYHPEKDIGFAVGNNGEIATLRGEQVRKLSNDALSHYEAIR